MGNAKEKVVACCDRLGEKVRDAGLSADTAGKITAVAESARGRELVVPVVGAFSAGKSTLIKIISGYHQPDQGGTIVLDGVEREFKSPRDAPLSIKSAIKRGCKRSHTASHDTQIIERKNMPLYFFQYFFRYAIIFFIPTLF